MFQDYLVYIVSGLVLAIAGFAYYAVEVLKAYNDEKRKIKEDFELSQKYEPEKAMMTIMSLIAMSFTGVVFTILLTLLLWIGNPENAPNTAELISKFIMIAGITSLIANISRMPYGIQAARDLSYQPILPDEIKREKDLAKRAQMIEEFIKNQGLDNRSMNIGKYFLFHSLPETLNLYALLIAIELMAFTHALTIGNATNISTELSSQIFMSGILYIILTIPAIFSMKKSSEIEMTQENLVKKVLVAFYGFIPSIIGLIIMTYFVVQLIH